jgi:hypothetical protein
MVQALKGEAAPIKHPGVSLPGYPQNPFQRGFAVLILWCMSLLKDYRFAVI